MIVIKVNKKISKKYIVGKEYTVNEDSSFWRNRIKDSEIDNCITVLDNKLKKSTKKIKKSEN